MKKNKIRTYANKAQEIAHHEILKQSTYYTYKPFSENLPSGYSCIDEIHNPSGLDAYVLKKGDDVLVAFRGTEMTSIKDWGADAKIVINKMPKQAKEAEAICANVASKYSNCCVTVTGHSLGGGTGSYGAAKTGLPAVVFNPIGTAGLIKDGEVIDDSHIVNYCNPRDWVAAGTGNEHIGQVYEISSKAFLSKADVSKWDYHKVEDIEDLRTRKESSNIELQRKYEQYKQNDKKYSKPYYDTALESYRENMGLGNGNSSECVGSYSVSGYTREDGTKVQGYIRQCGAKHTGSWRGKSFDKMTDEEVNQMLDDLI